MERGVFLTIKQLSYFLELVKTGSFTITAENMYISQSSLSKQIKALEDELGLPLFNRTTRRLELTAAGDACLRYATEIVRAHNQMLNTVSAFQESLQGFLRITLIPAAADYGILDRIMEFRQLYREIDLMVEEQDPAQAVKQLQHRKTDLCIMRGCLLNDRRYRIAPLVLDELVLITSVDHPFAKRSEIRLAEAAHEHFYLLSEQTHLYNYCIDLCRKAGFTPRVTKQSLRLNTIQNFVSANLGVSLVMKQVARQMNNDKLQIIPLQEHPTTDLSVVVEAGNYTEIVRLFLHYLQEYYKKNGPHIHPEP